MTTTTPRTTLEKTNELIITFQFSIFFRSVYYNKNSKLEKTLRRGSRFPKYANRWNAFHIAEKRHEMYQDLQRTCIDIILRIKPLFWDVRRCRCRRVLLNLFFVKYTIVAKYTIIGVYLRTGIHFIKIRVEVLLHNNSVVLTFSFCIN